VHLIEKLTDAIQAPVMLEGLPIGVEGSIGVAIYPDDAADADALLQHADVAMYVAKNDNKPYSFYEESRDTYDPIRLTLVSELRRAIDESELVLYYQPKAALSGGRIESVEALLRRRRHVESELRVHSRFLRVWRMHLALRTCCYFRSGW